MQVNRAFNPSPVESIQRGEATINASSVDITISAVDTAKAFVETRQESAVRAVLLNATTVRFKYSGGGTTFAAWQVVEYV